MASGTDDDEFDDWLVQPDHEQDDGEELYETLLRRWAKGLELLRDLAVAQNESEGTVSIAVHCYTGSAFNLGRVGDTGVRIERYNVGDKLNPRWRFLLADDATTYMHVDDREFATREELERAAVEWLVQAGRISWLN